MADHRPADSSSSSGSSEPPKRPGAFVDALTSVVHGRPGLDGRRPGFRRRTRNLFRAFTEDTYDYLMHRQAGEKGDAGVGNPSVIYHRWPLRLFWPAFVVAVCLIALVLSPPAMFALYAVFTVWTFPVVRILRHIRYIKALPLIRRAHWSCAESRTPLWLGLILAALTIHRAPTYDEGQPLEAPTPTGPSVWSYLFLLLGLLLFAAIEYLNWKRDALFLTDDTREYGHAYGLIRRRFPTMPIASMQKKEADQSWWTLLFGAGWLVFETNVQDETGLNKFGPVWKAHAKLREIKAMAPAGNSGPKIHPSWGDPAPGWKPPHNWLQ